ncbi:major facilitator superfamily multidrug-resistance, DHA1 sub-family [Gymnopilus junonius]|uniref:Major facilitator superfamily multidrug-resistance, DHA1 sub-family n=1 Tax=Gymnopilus junonius TaxID=109634 RepID=A0A9P5NDM0_GYMJU|nr:major facilitator superfamily multidrug-resistance, DHA1 sub-family [Gymnopilus junonius]
MTAQGESSQAEQASHEDAIDKPTPLPRSQLLSVFLIQGTEPITATVIYPFINQLVRETGITGGDETKTGYYAGVIESVFFFTECVTCVQWGYLSDRFGRRPILLCAPLGLTIAMFLFGSSTTFWSLAVSRCLQGLFNGNIGVAKSIIAELTDSTNRGDAYAAMPIIWNTGVTIGPILGGTFSNPAKQWPNSFGRIPYLRSHPYFLPCFLAGLFSFTAFLVALLKLKETLPSKFQKSQNTNDPEGRPLIEDENVSHYGSNGSSSSFSVISEPQSVTPPVSQAVFTPPILRTLMNHFFLAGLDMSHFVLLPLMYSTPLEYGGLGLDPFKIGFTLGAFGFVNSLIQANFLGGFLRKHGARKVYICSFSGLLGCFTMYPILKFFSQQAHGVNPVVVACIIVQLMFQSLISFAFGSLQVILVESVPEGGPLGAVNGVAQMLASGLRAIAPTFASSLFSLSLQKNLAGGNMVYYILIALTLVGIRCSFFMPSKSARDKKGTSSPTP